MIQYIVGIALVLSVLICIGQRYREKKIYDTVNQMLDNVLNGEKVKFSDIKEGEVSAIASKMIRIQEKMENELMGAKQEKEQVKSLISNMSHQLKTPLANVMIYQELLSQNLSRNLSQNEMIQNNQKQQQNFLFKMKQQLEKIDWILQSLFKMVKLEQGVIVFEVVPTSLQQTLLSAINTVYKRAEKKNIDIITEPFEDCFLYHNSKWTAEVFVNILENAIKYTDKNGKIKIRVHPMELFTEVQIEDNGIGVQESESADIFKRFYRSKDVENKEGSGIGLYLSRLILEEEKGYITVKSEYGRGSCFSVFLQNCHN